MPNFSKYRPKTQEKSIHIKKEPNKSSSQKRKLPSIPIKENKPIRTIRPNFLEKTKRKKPDKKIQKNSLSIQDDILDDIIFDKEQDSETWHKLMVKFRQNPVIISKLLRKKPRPITQDGIKTDKNYKKFEKVHNLEYTRMKTANNPRDESGVISNILDYRPISAPEQTLAIHHRKIQDPD